MCRHLRKKSGVQRLWRSDCSYIGISFLVQNSFKAEVKK